jgi:hypothetical protein
MDEMTDLNRRGAFSGWWPMAVGWAAMLIFACHASTHMVGAGDTWVALACGRHFINHGVDTNEPFSANSHRQGPTPEEVKTWPKWAQTITDKAGLETVKHWHPTGYVNQNWLTHVLFYWLAYKSPIADAESWCFNSLVYWKFTIYVITIICVYYIGRVLGANHALSAFSACAALFIGRSLFDIRPAGFSNLLVAVFLLILALATYRNFLYLWLILPVTIFWANVHGGYIYVFIMLTPFFVLHLLPILPKRWTVSLISILMWLGLYVLMYKFLNHRPFSAKSPLDDKMFHFVLLLTAASIATVAVRSIRDSAFYFCHGLASIVVFLCLLPRFFPDKLSQQPTYVLEYVHNGQLSFFVAFVSFIALGIIVTVMRDRLVRLSPRAIVHTAAVGIAAFAGAILFNPFHLTNLTHTFAISVSEYAEGWRNVHEWHPAFAWSNPVGTAFPFLVMLIIAVGLLVFQLYSRLFAPKYPKMTKTDTLLSQQKRFAMLSTILAYAVAAVMCWVVLVAFSLTDASIQSFLLCALFAAILLASALVSVHFIYLTIPLVLFALQTIGAAQGYQGRYIFPFVTIPLFVITQLTVLLLRKERKLRLVNILFVMVAAIAGLVLMMVFIDPFKFGNKWEIGQLLQRLWDLQRLWAPPYEANLELDYKYLFRVLYGVNAVAIGVWLVLPILKSEIEGANQKTIEQGESAGYELPKIDSAILTIAALTIYMAYCSRRFIPIAGIATCPLIAMFVEQLLQTIAAARNFCRKGRFTVPAVPRGIQIFLTALATIIVVSLGTYWTIRFKHVYLDPWPTDTKLTSVFMRMTASHIKPFYACRFIRDNRISGKMFNYWTEGGFIAWGEDPDPNTGHTPLQLFMDGRAQAAYDYQAYEIWSNLMFGGKIAEVARARNRPLTGEEYVQLGKWLDEQLRSYNVSVVLMPASEFDKPIVIALEQHLQWPIVFLSDKEKLFVDIGTPQGKALFDGITDGNNIYPDEYHKNVIVAHHLLRYGRNVAAVKQAIDLAIRAFELMPSRMPIEIINACGNRYPELRGDVENYYRGYLDDFIANEDKYMQENGYQHKMVGALVASQQLEIGARSQNNSELEKVYASSKAKIQQELSGLRDKRW